MGSAGRLAGEGGCVMAIRLSAPGHALTMEWSGEIGTESSSTGYCKCGGWEESASSQQEVRNEYRFHLRKVLGQVWNPTTRTWDTAPVASGEGA